MNSRNSLQLFKPSSREVWVSSLLSHIHEILVVFFLPDFQILPFTSFWNYFEKIP